MPLPKLTRSGLVPPVRATAAKAVDCSPYETTTLELCREFGGTPERRKILRGLLDLRAALRRVNPGAGFQWLSGDFFAPDTASRPCPASVAAATFCQPFACGGGTELRELAAVLVSRALTLRMFHVAHTPVLLCWSPRLLVQHAHDCGSVLGHQQGTGAWQGMFCIDLEADDSAAYAALMPAAAPAAAVGV